MKRHRMTNLYSGHVQGVGFRYAVKSITFGFAVTGTIRNLDDGRVELTAEGAKEELEAFLQAVRQSERRLLHPQRADPLVGGQK